MKTYTLNPDKTFKNMPSRIIRFLRGDQRDTQGRTLKEMHDLPDWKLERTHDVIQWMFPTDIASQHSEGAPVLTAQDIVAIKNDPHIQAIIQLSLTRMVEFYEKNDYWITQKNHNFLRLTRILRCLWLAGLKHDYVSLQKALDDVFIDYPDIVGEETYLYWKNANNDEFMKADRKADVCCDPKKTRLFSNLPAPKLIPENAQQQQLPIDDEHIRQQQASGGLDELKARAEFGMSCPVPIGYYPNLNPDGSSPVYNPAGDAPDVMGVNNYDDFRYI